MERQGSLLALLEPAPAMTAAMRETLVPMLAALLLEAAGAGSAETGTDAPEAAGEGGRDEQDLR